jgi:hypothetical protein
MANLIYNNAKKLLGDGTIDWDNGAHIYRVLLTTASYTPNVDTHIFVSSVTNELSGGAYVRKDITTRSIAVDTTNDRADYMGDNVTWATINAGTAAWAIIFKLVTNDADSPLILAVDLPDTLTNGTDFTVRWDSQPSNGAVFRVG